MRCTYGQAQYVSNSGFSVTVGLPDMLLVVFVAELTRLCLCAHTSFVMLKEDKLALLRAR